MHPELVDATALHALSDRLEARGLLPHVLRRLLSRTPGVTGLVVPAEEGIAAPGFDGRVDGGAGSPWVPSGASVWEAGANKDPKAKAQSDYDNRTAKPGGVDPADTAFVFAASRRWADGQDWAVERRGEGVWRDVQVRDAEALHGWLEDTPDVHIWLSERLGLRPLRVRTLAAAFDQLAARTAPTLPPGLVLAGRSEVADTFRAAVAGDAAVTAVRAGSRDEALAFVAAALVGSDDGARGEPLVVRDAETLERLALSDRPMTLVVRNPDLAETGHAAARGHSVILALGSGDFSSDDAIDLPHIDRSVAREALAGVGVPFESADRLAGLARRSFAALTRELSVAPGGARPRWATGDDAPLLAALLLVAGWSGAEGDRHVVETVTGATMADVEQALLRHVGSDDPPWARSAGSWRLVSPDDSWLMLNHLVTEQLLARWREQAVAALAQPDPRHGLDQAQRLVADIRGERRPEHSGALRSGLAQAAALLGARGEQPQPGGLVPARFAAAVVVDVLRAANADLTGAVWSSLAPQLPLLAEAAPEVFLDALDDGLAADPSPILALFTDGPGTPTLLAPSSPHSALLWALEGLAWSEAVVVRVVLALGELAAREPGGRTLNRPAGSLRAILLPWHPQTNASPARRLQALDGLRQRWPAVAWQLMLTLIPRMNDFSSATHQPRFRAWRVDDGEEPPDVQFAQAVELAARFGEDAGRDPRRWAELVAQTSNLPDPARHGLFDALGALDPDEMDEQERLVLWRALIDESERHRSMPDARWSLGVAYADLLSVLARRFEDPEPPERHARLFDHRVRVPNVPRDDFEAQRGAAALARRTSVAEVYAQGGLAYLRRLAGVSRLPRQVGFAHAADSGDVDVDGLFALAGTDGPDGAMASGWVAGRLDAAGPQWLLEVHRGALGSLSADGQVALLLELPATQSTWALVDELDDDVQAAYWRAVSPYRLDPRDLKEGGRRMLDRGRPWAAVDVLAASTLDDGPIDVDLADAVLSAAASAQPDAAVDPAHEVGQILDAMERSDAPIERLAVHEFAYFAILDGEREPRALAVAITDDPATFVDVARCTVNRDDGTTDVDSRSDLASHAHSVLTGLRRLPGQTDDGLDAGALAGWVGDVRARLRDIGRSDGGDEILGELLAGAPVDPDDEAWPHRGVRDAVDAARSARLESAIVDGHVRRRGPTIRGVYDGGRQERGLAVVLRRDADRLEVAWPRTARTLRTLATTYEGFGSHEDTQAQRDADAD